MKRILSFLLAITIIISCSFGTSYAYATESESGDNEVSVVNVENSETESIITDENESDVEDQTPAETETETEYNTEDPSDKETLSDESSDVSVETEIASEKNTNNAEEVQAKEDDLDLEDTLLHVTEEPKAAAAQNISTFVTQAYNFILGRKPDTGGFNKWVNGLTDKSLKASDMVWGFLFGNEYLKKNTEDRDYITSLYRALLGREPDNGGFNNWMKILDNGFSRRYVLRGFFESAEFKNLCNRLNITKGSVDNRINSVIDMFPKITDFVNNLYVSFLGRKADDSGRLDFVSILAEGDTAFYVVELFIKSGEFKKLGLSDTEIARALYKGILQRNPSSSEVSSKARRIDEMGLDYVVGTFINSAEFKKKAAIIGIVPGSYDTADYDKLYPEYADYVNELYTKLLGREPKYSERAPFVKRMGRGLDAASVVYEIVNSSEFASKKYSNSRYVTLLYQALLGRNPESAAVVNGKVSQLNAGRSRNNTLYSFLSSAEFKKVVNKKGISRVLDVSYTNNDFAIFNFLYSKIGNVYGVAGIMGNMMQESSLEPTIMEVKYQRLYGYTSAQYTKEVDAGTYTYTKTDSEGNETVYEGADAFRYDAAGYGLCQWTYHTRKAALYAFKKADGRSIGNMYLQLEHLYDTLKASNYADLLSALKKATSVDAATKAFLEKYEIPSNMALSLPGRVEKAKTIYNKYAQFYLE